jgi:hypothetical protein
MPGTTPYLTCEQFADISVVPAEFIREIEDRTPGWVDNRLRMISAFVDTRLAKRYDAPFKAPYPLAVIDWINKIVSFDVWLRRGVEPTDAEISEYKVQCVAAYAEIKEAADAIDGLFDLPLRADTDAGGVTRGFVRSSSQQSPYVWADEQRELGRQQDQGNR